MNPIYMHQGAQKSITNADLDLCAGWDVVAAQDGVLINAPAQAGGGDWEHAQALLDYLWQAHARTGPFPQMSTAGGVRCASMTCSTVHACAIELAPSLLLDRGGPWSSAAALVCLGRRGQMLLTCAVALYPQTPVFLVAGLRRA